MAVTDQQFLDHSNLNNAEFANRQVAIRGNGDPSLNGGTPGVMGWFYLDEDTTPHTRYEKVGPLDTDWTVFSAEGGGGTGGDPIDTSFYLTNSLTNIPSTSRQIVPMNTPTTPTYDVGPDWDHSGNSFVAPAAGLYTITAHVEYSDESIVYEKFVYLRSTGTYGHTVPGSSFSSDGENVLTVTGIFRLETGDRVYLEVEHYAPSSVDLLSASIHGMSNSSVSDHNHDDRYYTQTEVDAIIASAIGSASGDKELGVLPVESPNGSRTIFTLPNSDEFLVGTAEIWVNGLYEGQPTRISPTQIQVENPPLETGDTIRCSYIKSN